MLLDNALAGATKLEKVKTKNWFTISCWASWYYIDVLLGHFSESMKLKSPNLKYNLTRSSKNMYVALGQKNGSDLLPECLSLCIFFYFSASLSLFFKKMKLSRVLNP